MSAKPDFIQLQNAFTAHLREPDQVAAPSHIEDRRMQIYRELLFNNIESFMANNFPVLRQITDDQSWQGLIRDYFAQHRASTPLFPKLPAEFLRFLETQRQNENNPPYLYELAHYEWMESLIGIDTHEIPEANSIRKCTSANDLLDQPAILNPISQLLAYAFPVHRISETFQPDQAPESPTFLIVYRDRNDVVGFMELNQVTARLLELISQAEDQTTRDHLQQIAQEMQHPSPEIVIQGGVTVLQQLLDRDIVLGAKLN